MEALLGDEFPAFCATYDKPRSQGLRVNPLKIEAGRLTERLGLAGQAVPWADGGYYYPDGLRPGRMPDHAAGLYYIQEPSAMVVAPILDPQPGDRVLDLAAAPGGKTTHLAGLMQNQGLLVANEIHPGRARILVENLERMGVTCAVALNERPDRLAARLPGFFDRILVDAPCSGEGMFRKLPEASEQWSPGLPAACAEEQRQILSDAVAMLRPGGRLAYSTCTFAPEENEQVLLYLLETHPEMRLLQLPPLAGVAPARPDWTADPARAEALGIARAGRLWPHRLEGEGHFVALLEKAELAPLPPPPRPAAPARKGRAKGRERPAEAHAPSREAVQLYERFCRESLKIKPSAGVQQHDDWLYLPPEATQELEGLHVLRAGLQLGEVRKGRFEPAHALALALRADLAQQVHDVPVGSPDAEAYLRGETLPAAGEKGWTLITVAGHPLGWAKASEGVLKNHYPKGLRWLPTRAQRDEE